MNMYFVCIYGSTLWFNGTTLFDWLRLMNQVVISATKNQWEISATKNPLGSLTDGEMFIIMFGYE